MENEPNVQSQQAMAAMATANPYAQLVKPAAYVVGGIAAVVGLVLLVRTFKPGAKAIGEAKAEKKRERAEAIDARTQRRNERTCKRTADDRATKASRGIRPRRKRLATRKRLYEQYFNECINRNIS